MVYLLVDPSEWFIKAEGFLEEAHDDLERGRYWLVCFHMQQAVELYLKGFLVKTIGSYPFTHSLVELLESIENLDYSVPEEIYTYAEALEKHYTRARYPGVGLTIYNKRVAERCIFYGEKIIEFIKEILKE
ncbi:MAG: DNA-binding protein [Desulfurococcales archaeon ex4484_58]|nr:MAG: DNA-binding protein [Desulfurococcales archaeon ex4484_58]